VSIEYTCKIYFVLHLSIVIDSVVAGQNPYTILGNILNTHISTIETNNMLTFKSYM